MKNESLSTTYYVKTHQFGPTNKSPHDKSSLPDVKEWPRSRGCISFSLHPAINERMVYICTKGVDIVLLGSLANLPNNSINYPALVEIDLISRILCLSDKTTQTSNVGLVNNEAMIIDFRINSRTTFVQSDIVSKYFNSEYNFKDDSLMNIAMNISEKDKITIAKNSLSKWNLLTKLYEVLKEFKEAMENVLKSVRFVEDIDIDLYVQGVARNIALLMEA